MNTDQGQKKGWSVAAQGLAVLAAGAGLGSAMDAEAGIIYTDIPDAVVQNGSFAISLDPDLVVDFTLNHSFDLTERYLVTLSGPVLSDVAGTKVPPIVGDKYAFALPGGSPIGGATSFKNTTAIIADTNDPEKPFWQAGTNAYLGLRFDIAGSNHFGWAHIQTNHPVADEPGNVTLFGYAYCDQPNQGLLSGQTEGACTAAVAAPLPSGLALLAAGAVTALALRRKKDTPS